MPEMDSLTNSAFRPNFSGLLRPRIGRNPQKTLKKSNDRFFSSPEQLLENEIIKVFPEQNLKMQQSFFFAQTDYYIIEYIAKKNVCPSCKIVKLLV